MREVGDGNLNLVFIVRSAAEPDVPGIVLKQSLPWVRVFGEGWPLTVERAVREAHAYEAYTSVAGEALPAYLGFDEARYVIALEDLGDLRVWRGALNDGEIHAGRRRDRSDGSSRGSRSGPRTSGSSRRSARRASWHRATRSCAGSPRTWSSPSRTSSTSTTGTTRRSTRSSRSCARIAALRREVGLLKHVFRTHAEALIHGDLHTGSVMVGGGRTVVIDPEFAFYGPVAFDLGALWANAAIADARAARLGRPEAFRAHLASIVRASWDAFRMELARLWPERADPFLDDGFREAWVQGVWRDAVGFAGTKAIRRMIGFAHVSDIETLDGAGPVRGGGSRAPHRASARPRAGDDRGADRAVDDRPGRARAQPAGVAS